MGRCIIYVRVHNLKSHDIYYIFCGTLVLARTAGMGDNVGHILLGDPSPLRSQSSRNSVARVEWHPKRPEQLAASRIRLLKASWPSQSHSPVFIRIYPVTENSYLYYYHGLLQKYVTEKRNHVDVGFTFSSASLLWWERAQ